MADLTLVTSADLKARYPVFADASEPLIGALLEEARGSVNDTWIEGDQKAALLALAAHLLAIETFGSNVTAVEGLGQVAVTGALEEINVGDVKVRYARQFAESGGSGAGGGKGGMGSTTYGQRYLDLYRRSFPGVMVV